ncbi:MAG: PIN domain-containing protein [Thermoplasmatota archaeon]
MRYVVDANRLISALIRDGRTRREFLLTEAELFAPVYLREELEKHKGEILKRAPVSPEELDAALSVLEARITWVSEEASRPFLPVAEEAVRKIDPKDARYVACALAVKADAIWTFDKKLANQNVIATVAHLPVPPSPEGTTPAKREEKGPPAQSAARTCTVQCRRSLRPASDCECKGCNGRAHGSERPVGIPGMAARLWSFIAGEPDE